MNSSIMSDELPKRRVGRPKKVKSPDEPKVKYKPKTISDRVKSEAEAVEESKRPIGRPSIEFEKEPEVLKSGQRAEVTSIFERFFEAVDWLVEQKKIQSAFYFALENGFNPPAMYRAKSNGTPVSLHLLVSLAVNHNISSDWLLTGRGDMMAS